MCHGVYDMTMHIPAPLRLLVLVALWFSLVCGCLSAGRVFKSKATRLREAWDAAVKPIAQPISFMQLFGAGRQVYKAEPGASIIFAVLRVLITLLISARFLLRNVVAR
jgi:hypothetical protein